MSSFLEFRILSAASKEVLKGRVLISKLLAKHRRTGLFEPVIRPKLFKKREFTTKAYSGDFLPIGFVNMFTPNKALVPNPTDMAKFNR
jgi:hypothetical protein